MNKAYYLKPKYDTRKSFYDKALVTESKETIDLYSYNTLVARIHKTVLERFEIYSTQSPTTVRHIKEFLKQNGFGVYTTKELRKIKKEEK
jgi:hypothetical protein